MIVRNWPLHNAAGMCLRYQIAATDTDDPAAVRLMLQRALDHARYARARCDNNAEQCIVDGLFTGLAKLTEQLALQFPFHIEVAVVEH
jgi:hypothetical protein